MSFGHKHFNLGGQSQACAKLTDMQTNTLPGHGQTVLRYGAQPLALNQQEYRVCRWYELPLVPGQWSLWLCS